MRRSELLRMLNVFKNILETITIVFIFVFIYYVYFCIFKNLVEIDDLRFKQCKRTQWRQATRPRYIFESHQNNSPSKRVLRCARSMVWSPGGQRDIYSLNLWYKRPLLPNHLTNSVTTLSVVTKKPIFDKPICKRSSSRSKLSLDIKAYNTGRLLK